MDIGSDASSSLKRSSDAPDSPIDKRVKFDSIQDYLNKTSTQELWDLRTVTQNANDDGSMLKLHARMLVSVTRALALTNLKGELIEEPTTSQAENIANGLSQEDHKIWEGHKILLTAVDEVYQKPFQEHYL